MLPDRRATLTWEEESGLRLCELDDLEEVVDDLAAHRQVVTTAGLCERVEGEWRYLFEAMVPYELDYSLEWEELVTVARLEALTAQGPIGSSNPVAANVRWIDRADA